MLSGAPPPANANTTSLGVLGATYELYPPAARPRGVMVILHGGGWVDVGPGQVAYVRRTLLPTWLQHGWAAVIVGYRGCRQSIDDVLRVYDAVRTKVGPATPIGIVGESAGAHLALIAAAERPDVAVVIGRAGPTSAATLARGGAFDTGGSGERLPRQLAAGWRGTFGEGSWLSRFNPRARARDIKARVLLAQSLVDPIIPASQQREMQEALRAAEPQRWAIARLLDGGPVPFVHVGVTPAAMAEYQAAELDAIAPWQRGPAQAPYAVPGWWGETLPRWDGRPGRVHTERQCTASPLLTGARSSARRVRLVGRAMPGTPVRVAAGRARVTAPVSAHGRFSVTVRPASTVTIAQTSDGTRLSRRYVLPSRPSVRLHDGVRGRISVAVTGAARGSDVRVEVISPNGCTTTAGSIKSSRDREAALSLAAAEQSYVVATSNGISSLARRLVDAP